MVKAVAIIGDPFKYNLAITTLKERGGDPEDSKALFGVYKELNGKYIEGTEKSLDSIKKYTLLVFPECKQERSKKVETPKKVVKKKK